MLRLLGVFIFGAISYLFYCYIASLFNVSHGNMALIVASMLVADISIPGKDKHD